MNRVKQYLAIFVGVVAGLAAIGAGAMIVATSIVIGALMALAARLAVPSRDLGDPEEYALDESPAQTAR
mgnify:CR=1 FL=1